MKPSLPFDPEAPHFQWWISWRKRVALAKLEPENAKVWCGLAMVSQMRYETLVAIEKAKEVKP